MVVVVRWVVLTFSMEYQIHPQMSPTRTIAAMVSLILEGRYDGMIYAPFVNFRYVSFAFLLLLMVSLSPVLLYVPSIDNWYLVYHPLDIFFLWHPIDRLK